MLTGWQILRQAYGLLGDKKHTAKPDKDGRGLAAVNQIYGELWHREHRTRFQPLSALDESLQMTGRFMPALAYGAAMLLCVDGDVTVHNRMCALYRRAAGCTGGIAVERREVL